MHRRGLARGLRGLAAGSLTTTLALAFHLAGGGAQPSAVAIAGSFGGAIWLSIMIGRRRLSIPFLVVAVGASQVLLHTIFSVSTAGGALEGDAAHAGHGTPLELALGHGGHAMWWAHALAGIVTVLALARGERILRRLAELAAVAVRALLRVVLVVAVAPAATEPARVAPRRQVLRADRRGVVAALRGPPASLVIPGLPGHT